MDILKFKIIYQNTENRKTVFDHEISIKKYPNAIKLNKGSRIKMGDFETPKKEIFFESKLFPYKFDCWEDDTIFKVLEVCKN